MVWDVDVGLDYQGTPRRDVSAAVSGEREMSTIRGCLAQFAAINALSPQSNGFIS